MLKSESLNPLCYNQTQLRKKIQNYSFCLSDKIGRGYSSNVYRAIDDNTKQQVAIKVIQLKSLRDDVTKNLLRIQLECMKTINHPNLLKCINSFQTVNNCYIVTEFCEGGDLQKYLKKYGRFSQKQIFKFFQQFFQAYLSFYQSGYLHRDLKPANILLKQQSIKIADFGFVKRKTDPPKNNYNVGTPVYMPPQSLKQNIYTQKSDIWAMGVILYQLAHGKVPWNGLTEAQLKFKIQNEKPSFDKNIISSQLQDLIIKCLMKDPKQRISLDDIQKHSWYNYRQKTEYKQNIRKPLGDMTNRINSMSKNTIKNNNNILKQQKNALININMVRKASMSQRTTLDSNPMDKKSEKNSKNKNDRKKTLDSLITIMNFMRFIYKIYKFTNKIQEQEYIIKIRQYVGLLVLEQLSIYEQILASKQNRFNIPEWDSFVSTKKWTVFQEVVSQYSIKYHNNININTGKMSKLSLQQLIHQLYTIIETRLINNLSNNMDEYSKNIEKQYQKIQLLDYLISLRSMLKLIKQEDRIKFIQISGINQIVQKNCQITNQNCQYIWKQLKLKIKQK